jgi:hypothetical protein
MKLNKSVVVIILMVALLGCEPLYKLLINDSEKVSINFNNSEIELSAENIGATAYLLIVNYNLENEIIINKDAFNIEYKDKIIREYNLASEGKKITDKNCKLSGNGCLVLSFHIIEEGKLKWIDPADTIRITAPDFITYNGKSLSLGELIIVVGEKVEEKD